MQKEVCIGMDLTMVTAGLETATSRFPGVIMS